jgi:pyruvate formate lyase activating enzyme
VEQAAYYTKDKPGQVQCMLCPHHCVLHPGERGKCHVRVNENNELYTETYGQVAAMNMDPIEKKPLYHFYPGSQILSIGTFGCNFHCQFCQNCDISQASLKDMPHVSSYTPREIVYKAGTIKQNIGIAYTYNEPSIWYEFIQDVAKEAKQENLLNVMISNGYINQKPMSGLLEYMDAFNIDLKAFDEDFYKKYVLARLGPVKERVKQISKAGKHLEITNLVIPTLNDDPATFEEMVKWIEGETGPKTILHLSRYFPNYKMQIQSTSVGRLHEFYEIAKKYLHYVYLGNVIHAEGVNTYCDHCNKLVIQRNMYNTEAVGLDPYGKCQNCKNQVVSAI